MSIHTCHFPRQLETDGSADNIRAALNRRLIRIPEGELEVPLLELDKSLENAIRKARLQRRIRLGLDDILEKLAAEKKGLDELRLKTAGPRTDRISRLLFFSKDGADRLYRNIEYTLNAHAPRILGCMLDVKGMEIGHLITGKSIAVKVVLVEHKDAVSDILRSIA